MLPYFTSEVYSWADPENEDFGFKTGENSGLSYLKPAFPGHSTVTFIEAFPLVWMMGGSTHPMDQKSMVVIQFIRNSPSIQFLLGDK